jgi:hypothetical protein
MTGLNNHLLKVKHFYRCCASSLLISVKSRANSLKFPPAGEMLMVGFFGPIALQSGNISLRLWCNGTEKDFNKPSMGLLDRYDRSPFSS